MSGTASQTLWYPNHQRLAPVELHLQSVNVELNSSILKLGADDRQIPRL
jgi:hypothetical protein